MRAADFDRGIFPQGLVLGMAGSSPPPPEGLGLRDGLHVLAIGVHEERGIPQLCAWLDDSLQVALLCLGLQHKARHFTPMQA